MTNKFKIHEGQTVWLSPTGNNVRYYSKTDIVEAKVTKVARKYFYCERIDFRNQAIKFSLEDFSSVCEDCNAGWNIYETPELYVEERERASMFSHVRAYFSDFGNKKPSYEAMAKIASILYGENLIHKTYEGFSLDIDDKHRICTVYANQNEEYEYGDIYVSRREAAQDHPHDKIVFGFCIIDTSTGFIPEGCNEWNATIEDAIADFRKNAIITKK